MENMRWQVKILFLKNIKASVFPTICKVLILRFFCLNESKTSDYFFHVCIQVQLPLPAVVVDGPLLLQEPPQVLDVGLQQHLGPGVT